MLRRFLVFTIALFALFLLASWGQHKFAEQFQIFPQLESLYPPDPLLTFKRAFADLGPKKQDSEPKIPAAETAESSQKQAPGEDSDRPILASGEGFAYLTAFFDRLDKLEQSRKSGESDVLRILHFGDSIMWGDNLSIKMKDLFQSDFGDGGRGLVNIIDSPSSALQEH
ncbi:MAG: hypothetical protein KDK37_07605, partial [Leptospiraceae bacterium]|nr:hypothetical protein [Leptospiraceae bacterium]